MTAGISSDTTIAVEPSLHRRGLELLDRCRTLARENRRSEALEAGLRSVEILSQSESMPDLAAALDEVAVLHYNAGRYSDAIEIWLRCSSLYGRIGNVHAEAKARRNTGIAYSRIGSYDDALRELNASLHLYTLCGDRKGFGGALNSIGIVNFRRGSYEVAMTRSLEAIDLLSEEPADRVRLTEALLNVGKVFQRFGNLTAAMEQYVKALEVAEPHQHAEIYNDMAVVFSAQGEYARALESYLYAFRLQKHSPLSFPRAILIGNIGNAYMRLGRYPIAARYQKLSCNYFEKCGDHENLARSLRNLSTCYLHLEQYAEALVVLQKALAEATRADSRWEVCRVHDALHDHYLATGSFEPALENFKKAQAIRDELVSAEKEKMVESLQREFELERHLKEEEIRQRNNVVQSVIDAQESERQRIARDLHDGVGQLVAAAGINLARVREMVERNASADGVESELALPLGRAAEIISRVASDIRTISHALGTSTLRELGLHAALGELLANLESPEGTRFELMTTDLQERLPEPIEIGLFRIAQELVANVLRHANASEATIQIIRQEEEVRLTVEDNGAGFDMSALHTGMGRRNIAARVAAMGAELHYDSTPGHGTTVTVVLTLE